MMAVIEHPRFIASPQETEIEGCMAFQHLSYASIHLPTFDLLCHCQSVRGPSHMVAFHPQRLGRMVSQRHEANVQGLCNFSHAKMRICFERLLNAFIQSLIWCLLRGGMFERSSLADFTSLIQ
jgi:hypothetical protein